jgi:hypothetical protein
MFVRYFILASVFLLMISTPVVAQHFEIHPYIGGMVPARWAHTSTLASERLLGVRGGVFLTGGFEVDGNFAYLDHFRFEDRDMGARAFLWDVNGAYSVGPNIRRFEPFVTFGIGQTTVTTRGEGKQRVLLLDPTFRNPDSLMSPIVLNSGDTFLTLNYGGGFKALRLWGPVGLRTDLRGRTMPDFFGHANHWFEITAGINLAWGER